MKTKRILLGVLMTVLLAAVSAVVYAQVKRPYHNGSVWNVSFIRMKPGMDSAYLNYIATDWKKSQDALKAEGQIISYKVLTTEAHGSTDWNIMLMTEYKDLATMEANAQKTDALMQKVIGDDEAQRKGYQERLAIREVMGTRLSREIVLEPKP